ncbi:hypothetical protein CUJ83_03830 [Methanocella sp. CWC-04]|uniref:Uncharacterized protein n=1 Tax=Methanooceanicella nereidis TaxID=2052831 RepID=A0AAP2RB32_9EURY|nr:hypothetical protein [Methanocella sp. CWC-04]
MILAGWIQMILFGHCIISTYKIKDHFSSQPAMITKTNKLMGLTTKQFFSSLSYKVKIQAH